jgi:pimeloyl-ACP methyl ester carboxylesterase
VICPDLPGPALPPDAFSPEAQAFAAQGYMVATINYRGVDGLGRRHRDAIRSAPDRVAVEDIRAAVGWLAGKYAFNPQRVALLGVGFGGYVALRALELHPTEFRAVISVDAPLEFQPWLTSTGLPPLSAPVTSSGSRIELVMPDLPLPEPIARRREFFGEDLLKRAPAIAAGALTKPVFFLQDPARTDLGQGAARELREQLHRRDIDAEYLELRGGLAATDPAARAELFGRLGEFLDATMYDFGVKIGELKEVK